MPYLRPVLIALALLAATAGAARAAPNPEALRLTRVGAQAYEQGAVPAAVEAFEAALALEPEDASARKNLALALARQARSALGRRAGEEALALLDRALELHPFRLLYEALRARALLQAGRRGAALRQGEELVARSPQYALGWLVLAEVQERAGELPAALTSLAQVTALRPKDTALARRIKNLRRRAEAEAGFSSHGSGNFIVKYDPKVDAGLVQLAITILEDAYSRVTADLGIAPRTQAHVVLYEGAEFQRVTGAHSWVGALYQNGVLRLPIRNLKRHRATAERVLTHEFTHHVLRERTPSLPIWWHEGIAQFLEDTPDAGRRRRREIAELLGHQQSTSRLIRFGEMQKLTITSVANAGTVKLYYAQALSFVGWLVDEHGAGGLPTFLTALGSGTDLDAAATRAFGSDQAALWKDWLAALSG